MGSTSGIALATVAGCATALLTAGLIRIARDAGLWGAHGHRLSTIGLVFAIWGAAILAFAVVLAIQRAGFRAG